MLYKYLGVWHQWMREESYKRYYWKRSI